MSILLDLDGVIVDFISGAIKAFGMNHDEVLSRWQPGEWHIEPAMRIPESDFWQSIERVPDFWINLPAYSWADDLYDQLAKLDEVIICTTPTRDHNCASGKIQWLQKWKGKNFRKYVITAHKEILATESNILVDDRDDNIRKFVNKGGKGVLFPAIQNSRHYARSINVSTTIDEVKQILSPINPYLKTNGTKP